MRSRVTRLGRHQRSFASPANPTRHRRRNALPTLHRKCTPGADVGNHPGCRAREPRCQMISVRPLRRHPTLQSRCNRAVRRLQRRGLGPVWPCQIAQKGFAARPRQWPQIDTVVPYPDHIACKPCEFLRAGCRVTKNAAENAKTAQARLAGEIFIAAPHDRLPGPFNEDLAPHNGLAVNLTA